MVSFFSRPTAVRKKNKQNQKNIYLNWSELILQFYSGQKGIGYLKRNCVEMGILCYLDPSPCYNTLYHQQDFKDVILR